MRETIALAAILTGGQARRMGGEKHLAQIGGHPLVELVYKAVGPLAEETVCVGEGAQLERFGVKVLPDLYPGADSLGGIATALDYAWKKSGPDSLVLCVGCDMPFIRSAMVEALALLAQGHDGAVPRLSKGYEPLLAVYRARVFKDAFRLITEKNLRIRDLFKTIDVFEMDELTAREVDPLLRSFLNVNFPEDLRAARLLAVGEKKEGRRRY